MNVLARRVYLESSGNFCQNALKFLSFIGGHREFLCKTHLFW